MFYTDINIIFTEGQDKCEAALVENKKNNEITVDEIQAYQDGRYLCAPEACASLFRFEPNRKSHTVQRLPVHLPDQQRTVFEEHQAQEAVDAGPRHTELLAYFDLNRGDGLDEETSPNTLDSAKGFGSGEKRQHLIMSRVHGARTSPSLAGCMIVVLRTKNVTLFARFWCTSRVHSRMMI